MDNVNELYLAVRQAFPAVSSSADRFYEKRWRDMLGPHFHHAWFEALADAVNAEIAGDVLYTEHVSLFRFMERAFLQGSEPIQRCIDTEFVENLFWQVASVKCAPYWQHLPPKLRQLYTDFHGRDP